MGFLSPKFILIGVIILFIVSSLGIASCNKKRVFEKKKTLYKEDTIKRDVKVENDVKDVEDFNKYREDQSKKFIPQRELTEEEKERKREEGRMLHFINQRKLKR